ncbi:divalent cation transporter [Ancylostoma duodenale]|uniref:Divalent cation transporter n=1 Tax=Ancylostoma duodenale TaxID=51022 RepID=A0A0C2GKV3_9BILA|nr:divalent cation transporter [Ancylostoma duodenale]
MGSSTSTRAYVFASFYIIEVSISGAGIIQAHGLKSFPELTVYQPLITGVAGNRASLQSARISSYVNTYKGTEKLSARLNPWTYYTSPDSESRAALLIILTSVPYHAFFVSVSYTIAYATLKPLKLSFVFLAGYMCAVFIQIFFLVYIAQVIVYWMYHFRIDPDMHAIPMVTATGDLVGTALLVSLFYVMSYGDDFVLKSSAMSETPSNATLMCSYE